MINLIFRLDLDNGEYAGTGHFKRVEMIYKYLKKKHSNINFFFLYKELTNSKTLLDSLSRKNHIIFDKNFENKLSFVKKNDIILCDTPFGIDQDLKKLITSKNLKKIILIDDLNKPLIKNCTIINGIIYFKKKLIKSKNIKLYQGPNYVLLNKNYVSTKIKKENKIFTILVCLGGTDLNNNLSRIVKILDNISNIKILLIIGSQIKNDNKIFNLPKKKNIIFIIGKKNIYKYFHKADIALTAGGITMFESISLNKPTLVYQTYNHQKYAINYFRERKLIQLIGKNHKIYHKDILNLINYYKKLRSYKTKYKKNMNNSSYNKIMNIIEKIINK